MVVGSTMCEFIVMCNNECNDEDLLVPFGSEMRDADAIQICVSFRRHGPFHCFKRKMAYGVSQTHQESRSSQHHPWRQRGGRLEKVGQCQALVRRKMVAPGVLLQAGRGGVRQLSWACLTMDQLCHFNSLLAQGGGALMVKFTGQCVPTGKTSLRENRTVLAGSLPTSWAGDVCDPWEKVEWKMRNPEDRL